MSVRHFNPIFPMMNRREALQKLSLGAAATGAGLALASTMNAAGGDAKPAAPLAESEVGFAEGKFILPPLPYAYEALEPAIDKETMTLHHDKHHAAYVKGANGAVEKLAGVASGEIDEALAKHWTEQLAFHTSGHLLHIVFWNSMSPKGGAPAGKLADTLTASFGSREKFEKLFSATAAGVQGSGWAILGYLPMTGGLHVIQAEKHQDVTIQGLRPLLAIDVWEHAYYLKYQNKRADYIKAFLGIINWEGLSAKFEQMT